VSRVARFDHVGDVAPALLVQLAPRERVMVQVDSVRYRDPGIAVDRVKYTYPNPTGRFPRTLWHYFETLDGPGTATVSTGEVGEIRLGTLPAGQSILLHGASLVAHESTMGFELATLASYLMPRSVLQSYLLAARLSGPGHFAYQTHGNALTFNLAAGEKVRTDPASLLSLTPGMKIEVRVFGGSPHFPPMHYFPLVDVTGPGTVLLHSGRVLYTPGAE
jgi:uncharacterized protein (AIM24 family)